MSDTAGVWTPDELRTALDAPGGLPPARPAVIGVERLDRTGVEGEGVVVHVLVRHTEGVERWQLTFDSLWADVAQFPLADAALMVRANIVEWWDTGEAEPVPPWRTAVRLD